MYADFAITKVLTDLEGGEKILLKLGQFQFHVRSCV